MSRDFSSSRSFAGLGTVLLFGGLFLLLLCGIESADGLRGMPRFWYTNRIMWWGLALGSVAGGVWCLSPRDIQSRVDWSPTRPGIRFQHLVVYTRPGCHLCDDAMALLQLYRRWLPQPVEVSIDGDPRLVESYGTCVPVITLDGRVRFRGKVSAQLLQRLIEGTPPR